MPVVAIVNRKGGSGKSTLATNIAAWCARSGYRVMLGDLDRQRSVNSWLSRRPSESPLITTWAVDRSKVMRPPAGTTHVVLDTPGALYDHDLAKLAINVSAMVVPIGPSLFDLDASLPFLHELHQLPRVSSGRCQVVAVGMRWPEEKRREWLASAKHWETPLLTVIPEATAYSTCLERGASIFDHRDGSTTDLMEPWDPLLRWLQLTWSAQAPTVPTGSPQRPVSTEKAVLGTNTQPPQNAAAAAPSVMAPSVRPQVTALPASKDKRTTVPHKLEPARATGWLEKLISRRTL